MENRIKLREICHARSGDKGDIANVGLIVYDLAHYEWIRDRVTAEAVHEFLAVPGPVERYELANIGALNFVLNGALGGGVSRTLMMDGHGKGFSAILLDMEIEAPPPGAPVALKSDGLKKESNAGRVIRLGTGSAYEGDRVDAARKLAESGQIDYLIFDCLAEKTVMEATLRKVRGGIGYDVLLESKLREVLPHCARHGIKIIANGGAADVEGAAQMTANLCRKLGLKGIKIAYDTKHDVLDLVRKLDPIVPETDRPVSSYGDKVVAAHAYQGARPIVEGLQRGADIVLTGRAGDSAQFLGPMMYEFGWSFDDWNLIGKGLGIGHPMECAGQVTGGFYADPEYKEVLNLAYIGFPIAEVQANGDAVITKLPGTGGLVSTRTVKEQILYEIHNPANYMHTDGVVDFTTTQLRDVGVDRVSITGTRGHPRPATTKILLGILEGFVGTGRIVYTGPGAYDRARLAADVVVERLATLHGFDRSAIRCDFIGYNSVHDWGLDPSILREIQLRITARCETEEQAWKVLFVTSELPCNGPAGGLWGRPVDQGGVEQIIGHLNTYLPQEVIPQPDIQLLTVD